MHVKTRRRRFKQNIIQSTTYNCTSLISWSFDKYSWKHVNKEITGFSSVSIPLLSLSILSSFSVTSILVKLQLLTNSSALQKSRADYSKWRQAGRNVCGTLYIKLILREFMASMRPRKSLGKKSSDDSVRKRNLQHFFCIFCKQYRFSVFCLPNFFNTNLVVTAVSFTIVLLIPFDDGNYRGCKTRSTLIHVNTKGTPQECVEYRFNLPPPSKKKKNSWSSILKNSASLLAPQP